MNTLSCFIVEDDLQALDYATNILTEYNTIELLGSASGIQEAAVQIKKLQPDFIILDVYLDDGNAFEFLNLFNIIDFKIIFTTSYAKHAIEAFKFSALDYLLKPYDPKELIVALEKVKAQLISENYQSQLNVLLNNYSKPKEPKKIVLKNSDAIYVVLIDEILFAKSDNNYTTFHLVNDKQIVVSKPLKSFEQKLIDFNFFRSHQRYLINLDHITSFNKRTEELILVNETNIPVAQSKKQTLLQLISNKT